jgi:DNA polymerase II small subunit/DNA polymerase delta subunit B
MINSELLQIIKEKGVLLDKEIFEILNNINDSYTVKKLLENFENVSGQKMITKSSILKSWVISKDVSALTDGIQPKFLNIFIKLGIQINLNTNPIQSSPKTERINPDYTVHYAKTTSDKKIEVSDFVGHFRARYKEIQNIILRRNNLDNLMSINKISNTRQQFSIIGMVSEKRITKNKNLIVVFEDLTGKTNVVFKQGSSSFKDANELQLDEVVAVRCSGTNELIMGYDIFFPDSFVAQKTKFDEERKDKLV